MLVIPLLLQELEWVELSGCLSQLDLLLGFEPLVLEFVTPKQSGLDNCHCLIQISLKVLFSEPYREKLHRFQFVGEMSALYVHFVLNR